MTMHPWNDADESWCRGVLQSADATPSMRALAERCLRDRTPIPTAADLLAMIPAITDPVLLEALKEVE
jgi:hypothetical protein